MANHPIVHIEIAANDLQAMKKFYGEAFGWTFQDYPDMNYVTFRSGEGQPGGGFNPVQDSFPAGTITFYIHTDDLSASVARVEQLGGNVLESGMEIPGVGTMAFFHDPTGNLIALLQPAEGGM
ncbi:MAG: VOC family protein [Anaerolineae bacterium]|nr:VOC family protein [Anaerolineae bacterium]